MSLASVAVVALALGASSPYVRSKVDSTDPHSHCLYWPAGTVTYSQSQAGNPATGGNEFGAISRSFQSWQSIMDQCGNLTLTEGQRLPDRTIGFDAKNLANNVNIILFREKSCAGVAPSSDACWQDGSCNNKYDCWGYSDSTIALTTTTYDTHTGRLYDADVEFNAGHFYFTTVDSPVCTSQPYTQSCAAFDVQNTMTHEAGHFIGLDHTDYPGSTMNPTAPLGEISKRTIDSGSRQFVCDAYPKGNASQDCVVLPLVKELTPLSRGCAAGGLAPIAWAGAALAGLLARRRGRR